MLEKGLNSLIPAYKKTFASGDSKNIPKLSQYRSEPQN